MRLPSLLVATASALVLAGALTACSGGTAPTTPAASTAATGSALDLVGTVWHVAGRDGTTARFDGAAVTVAAGGDSSTYSWTAQGDQVLVGVASSALSGPVAAPWLTATTAVRRTGDGWTLQDARGGTTARLTGGGRSEATTDPTLLRTARPGAGVVDRAAGAIEGRWRTDGDARATIAFTGGGWQATSSCRTGAVGGSGAYRVLPGGRLLVVRTATPIRGCPITDGPVAQQGTAITAIARAGSFRVHGDVLTLFDRTGAALGSLSRA